MKREGDHGEETEGGKKRRKEMSMGKEIMKKKGSLGQLIASYYGLEGSQMRGTWLIVRTHCWISSMHT